MLGGLLGDAKLSDIGATGLVVVIVLMVLFGYLVPKAVLAMVRRERDDWHKAHDRSEATRELQAQTLTQILTYMQASTRIVQALPVPPGEREGRTDG